MLTTAVAGSLAGAAGAAEVATPSERAFLQGGLGSLIANLHDRDDPSDAQYWSNGVFESTDPACIPCHLGPATAGAVLGKVAPAAAAPWTDAVVTGTFDRAIQDQSPDGAFPDPSLNSLPISTMFFANELGTALLEMRGRIPEETTAHWTTALQRTADRTIAGGEHTYYANGNIQLGYAEQLYLTWLATADIRYREAFEIAWTFAIDPPQTGSRAGRGLKLTKVPTVPDGSDGAGYLTEQSGSQLGYDPSYTQLQADVLSRLYLLTKDPRVLRVLNLVTNQLRQRVDSAGMLDTDGGTRVSLGRVPFTTPALAVLASTGARPDLTPAVRAQIPQFVSEYHATIARATAPQYRSVGTQFAVVVQTITEGADAPTPVPVVPPVPKDVPPTEPTR